MAASSQEDIEHLTPTRRVTSNGKINSLCNGCSKIFDSNDLTLLEAMGKLWHINCFKCTVCNLELPEHYYIKENLPYCKDHYYELVAHKCYQCTDYITGPTVAMGFSRMYHPECFHCTTCSLPLGEKDTYCLLSTKEILCNTCSCVRDSDSNESMLQNGHSSTYVSIQQIRVTLTKKVKFRLDGEAPKSEEKKVNIKDFTAPKLPHPGQRNIKHSLKIMKLPKSLIDTPLKTGDTILEINSIPIVDQDQNEINLLMKAYSDCLYLTIERKRPALSRDVSQDSSHDIQAESSTLSLTINNEQSNNTVSTDTNPLDEHFNTLPTTAALRSKGGVQKSIFSPSRASVAVVEDVNYSNSITTSILRSYRAQSVPAIDGRAEYTQCFRLSDLEIGEVIGRGFYGNVVKVTHKHTRQVMVMKEMKNCTDDAKKTFSKEVQMLKNLNHPNILHFIGILYQEGKLLTLITEFIGGGTLRKTIKNFERPFPWELRIRIARDIAAGMSYLHKKGIIHRDLTSKNCLLRNNMAAVVADFGLARVFQPQTFSNESEKKRALRMTVVGSPYWMAPEMLKGDVYDEKVDIFSYGIVLCEIISRVKADPDQLPRLSNFGLDEVKFHDMKGLCPQIFYTLAIKCSSLAPDGRPHFYQVEIVLNYITELLQSVEIGKLPADFDFILYQCTSTTPTLL